MSEVQDLLVWVSVLSISFPVNCLILSWSQFFSWVLALILLIKGSLFTKETSPGPTRPPSLSSVSAVLLSLRGICRQLLGALDGVANKSSPHGTCRLVSCLDLTLPAPGTPLELAPSSWRLFLNISG